MRFGGVKRHSGWLAPFVMLVCSLLGCGEADTLDNADRFMIEAGAAKEAGDIDAALAAYAAALEERPEVWGLLRARGKY